MKIKATDIKLVGHNLIFCVDEVDAEEIDRLKGKDLLVDFGEMPEPRSAEQNRLLWALIQEIQQKLLSIHVKVKANDLYRGFVRSYSKPIPVHVENAAVAATLTRIWRAKDHGTKAWDVEMMSDDGKELRLWRGSSDYDKQEMIAFLNGVIDDASTLGIYSPELEDLISGEHIAG